MSWMERSVDFNCAFASMITIEVMISTQVLSVVCLTIVLRCAGVIAEFLGIPRNGTLRGIVLHNQMIEVFAYLFCFGEIRFAFHFIFIHGTDSHEYTRQ